MFLGAPVQKFWQWFCENQGREKSIDWLPACIVERKIVPATQLEVK